MDFRAAINCLALCVMSPNGDNWIDEVRGKIQAPRSRTISSFITTSSTMLPTEDAAVCFLEAIVQYVDLPNNLTQVPTLSKPPFLEGKQAAVFGVLAQTLITQMNFIAAGRLGINLREPFDRVLNNIGEWTLERSLLMRARAETRDRRNLVWKNQLRLEAAEQEYFSSSAGKIDQTGKPTLPHHELADDIVKEGLSPRAIKGESPSIFNFVTERAFMEHETLGVSDWMIAVSSLLLFIQALEVSEIDAFPPLWYTSNSITISPETQAEALIRAVSQSPAYLSISTVL